MFHAYVKGAVPPDTVAFIAPLFALQEASVALPPINKGGFTTTVVVAVAVQPAVEVELTVIVNVPGVFMVYSTFCPDVVLKKPPVVLQEYVLLAEPLALKLSVSPWQIVLLLGEIETVLFPAAPIT